MNGRSSFASNVEMLLLYVLDENNSVTPDCRELTVRIYDHFQLALHQIENVNNILSLLRKVLLGYNFGSFYKSTLM